MPEPTATELLRDLMSANHAAVMEKLSAQDKVLENVQREVRRTNGRVTALEQRNATNDGRVEEVRERRERTRFLLTATYVIAGSALGGTVGAAGHAAGLW